jgi:hypothetical protein
MVVGMVVPVTGVAATDRRIRVAMDAAVEAAVMVMEPVKAVEAARTVAELSLMAVEPLVKAVVRVKRRMAIVSTGRGGAV